MSERLRPHWNDSAVVATGLKPPQVCQIELALFLNGLAAPDEPAEGAYTLLSGYPYAHAAGLVTGQAETAIAAGRHLLWTLRRRRTWHDLLDVYQALPERLRAYDVSEPGKPPRALRPTIADTRRETYLEALSHLPAHATHDLRPAPPGRNSFTERRRSTSVTIPADLVVPPRPGHDLAAGRPGDGSPLTPTRTDLADVAAWMDDAERADGVSPPGNWMRRFADLRFALRTKDGADFAESGELPINGLLHLVGMVGAGKSTLMVLLAVWAARRGLRSTLVVGDVAEQLRLVETIRRFTSATPLLGSTTRPLHVQRLHRRLSSQGLDNLLDHDEAAFDDLSTACVVDALRGVEPTDPLRFADAPCATLYPEHAPEAETDDALPDYRPGGPVAQARPRFMRTPHSCPIWRSCPRHRAAMEQVDSLVWVANPASLVQSLVARQLNAERLRQLELACLMSDLVIVDEADAVQMKLDGIFSPSATLVQPGPDSWLDGLQTHKIGELSMQGRLQLTDVEIGRWSSALTTVGTATDRLYQLLISSEALRAWVDVDYFSPWTLQEKFLKEWFGEPLTVSADLPDEAALYETDAGEGPEPSLAADLRGRLTRVFDDYRDDPLGDRAPRSELVGELTSVTKDLLSSMATQHVQSRVETLLRTLVAETQAPADDLTWITASRLRLEFLLLLTALDHRLVQLTHLWPAVEAAMKLDSTGNEMSKRPPQDYAPVVPESPMGNVLGYQFLPDESAKNEDGQFSGTLRFFRCAGVGRELLLLLHRFGADPGAGRPGAHVVLMSGTSWAGASSRAHVLEPVGAVLMPSETSLQAVNRSRFATLFLAGDDGRPMRLSGVDPKVRPLAAAAMARKLGAPGRGGTPSLLERELARADDDSRRRALLLVGSYKEANVVARVLDEFGRWSGRVRVLVADDADLDVALGPGSIRRGDLASFADDPNAEILVAPLMAVERGHNILNAEGRAAFGIAFFLARPHPRPDDLSLAVFAINDWAARFVRDQERDDERKGPATFSELVTKAASLDQAALNFRHEAREEWRRLLTRRYAYSRLPKWEQKVFAWDQLVTLWQVIGRLVRGGVPARVVFVDASFDMRQARAVTSEGQLPPPGRGGLLGDLHAILSPYFSPDPSSRFADPADPALARLLYRPLYGALCALDHHS
ncbi:hypothetical protein [Herbidospora galbida]|uniref:pPIWI_RE_Z domain-containing protein n=1 Tax=Herbidospora galbida TaxID=2575442 RepID=UPI001BAEB6E3|nr:hypothetical protein [Herbidospora galbida]